MEPTTIGQRIRAARKKVGLTQQEIANVFDISREAVAMWEKDQSVPPVQRLTRLAQELQVRTEWLMTGKGTMDGEQPRMVTESFDPAQIHASTFGTQIPVMGTAEGGPDGMVEWNGEIIDYVSRPPFLAGARSAYALWVTGTSMKPRYDEGELIYVHPGLPIYPESYVVAQVHRDEGGGTPAALIKQFVKRTEKHTTFRQFNPAKDFVVPTKRIVAVHRIVGSGQFR